MMMSKSSQRLEGNRMVSDSSSDLGHSNMRSQKRAGETRCLTRIDGNLGRRKRIASWKFLVLIPLVVLGKSIVVVSAFVPVHKPLCPVETSRFEYDGYVRHHGQSKVGVLKARKRRGGEADTDGRWLRWMKSGISRNTEEIKLRQAEELGGIPTSGRYSSRDWFHNTMSLPSSAILKDIRSPVIAVTSWATFLSFIHRSYLVKAPLVAQHMCIPATAHSLMSSALGLLLVFRTNSAYQRFAEGRKIWEHIINHSRDLSRMVTLYEKEVGSEKRRRVQRLLASFPYLLRHRIRPNLVMKHLKRVDDAQYERDPEHSLLLYKDSAAIENDAEAAAVAKEEEISGKSRRKTRPLYWVDKRTLPWRLLPSGALEQCARAQNRPLWVCDRLSAELKAVPDGPTFTNRERMTLLDHVNKLSGCLGACERIHQTVVPLNYARHALRALTLWLFTLPFAMVRDLGVLTGPIMFLVSWLLFGVYEIGYSIEDPFQGTLRLSILCDAIRRDVLADDFTRGTAFTLDPEVVNDQKKKTKTKKSHIVKLEEGGDESYEESPPVAAVKTIGEAPNWLDKLQIKP